MSETFTYDVHGNILTRTDFNGQVTTFTYDLNHRLLHKSATDGTPVSYTYSATGQRATVTDARGVISYHYDTRDRLSEVVHPDGTRLTYTYDAAGNRTGVTPPSGTTTYSYDARNQLYAVADPTNGVTTYTYDNAGNIVQVTYPNGTSTDHHYDRLHRLTSIETKTSTGDILTSFTYTLDPSGKRIGVIEHTGRHIAYTYDAIQRLVAETITDPLLGTQTITYTYDAVGNRLTKTDTDGTIAYTYDANDRLLTAGGRVYVYDANGNTLAQTRSGQTTTFTYDDDNRLLAAYTPSNVFTYTYDADGVRVRSTVDGVVTQYLVDTNRTYTQVLEEYAGGGEEHVRYVYGHDLISQTRQDTATYFHYDGLGSARMLTDTQAVPTDTYTFDAFGTLLSSTESTDNSYRFTGEPFDSHTGLYYLRSRYYQPEVGRFLTTDRHPGNLSAPLTLHKYLYAGADPVNRIDPSGLFFTSSVGLVTANTIRTTLASVQADVGFAVTDQIQYGGDAGIKSLLRGAVITGGAITVLALGSILRRASRMLPLPPGRPQYLLDPNRVLESHELVQAREIITFRGGTFRANGSKGFPGIDGMLDGIPISMKWYDGKSPQGILKHASRAERSAANAGYVGVELFIRAKNVKASLLLDFAHRGGLSRIPHQGTIIAINVDTADGWVRLIGKEGM